MTPEEAQAIQEERERLINYYNQLVERYNRLVAEFNRLQEELVYSINATQVCIENAQTVQRYVVPKLDFSASHVDEVARLVAGVQKEIEILSAKYFVVKHISTASKNLTQLNNQYQREFGLYNMLRRVTLGYVVGVDKNIISSEKLRTTVEKNYLQNADYWISHCLMATMLWVSDEREAAERAVAKAMSIDKHKSALFFLLINLQFGRSDAAAKWFEFYIQDVDVNNIGDEIRILLQAYLYNVFGGDEEFKKRIRQEWNDLLESIRNHNLGYDAQIKRRVLEFIAASVHKSSEEFIDLQRHCQDYKTLMTALDSAEKNSEFAKYFTELYEADSSAPQNLIERIQNVLYDLVNTYDEAEMAIVRSMDYNEMVLQARGDIVQAQKMYALKYKGEKAQTLGDLMIKLALPSGTQEVDIRVRRFAVTFLCESMIKAFEDYKKQYEAPVKEKHEVIIDSFKVTVDEKNPQAAELELRDCYKKNKNKLISRDKGVKTLTVFTIIFWAAFVITTAIAVIGGEWSAVLITAFILTFVLAVLFTIWLIVRRRQAGAQVMEQMLRSIEQLNKVVKALADWREKFTAASANITLVRDALKKFKTGEEE